ncbi:zinc-ribbon domain-containing protein [Flavobacterium sp. 11]|uniref:zinc-ribbon domain-containing protein n=1 Tax=Flavobacterium sp. 11 TaxID=357523 RepID=UPI000C18A8D9|nr:zinc-ribbon domain-containing protein [Flavobacterium sp. 11]PIF63334.1 zinc ribbon family protein [Flavobacterium sp. 11]
MMVLIGTRDSKIKNGKIIAVECPKCESKASITYNVYSRYTHITLIPIFPVSKIIDVECNNCKEIFGYENLSEDIKIKLQSEKEINILKTPIWMFSGLIILVGYITFWMYTNIQTNDKTNVFIQNPILGDVYNLKFTNGYYSTMRIDQVTKDSVYATQNDYDAYLQYEVDEIDKPENYTNRKVKYSKKDLIILHLEDEIFSITRN